HKDDKTVIVPTDHAVLTLTTCYPFYTPGYHPDRYIVQATLVKSKSTIKSNQNKVSVNQPTPRKG
ncbi:MAG: sortase domain-bontaining protein, partial [Ignavibacteriales bacterium]